MSNSRLTVRDLVAAYDHSLEQQIVGRGSNLACRDEELWEQVDVLLRDGGAQETHCLGLDPLKVMEETLVDAATSEPSGRKVKTRGGLRGLAKAFEVLEQAALNLYLGSWREEYKVVKMYSGMFTHYIKPVLSLPQIEKLFGLLGYEPSSNQQLCLQRPRLTPASLDDLLSLSCAFFVARCECHLLLTALGRHGGEAEWELSVVRERQRGNSVQVALENTEKNVSQPGMEAFDGDVDLYTDDQVNGRQRDAAATDDGGPRSLTWVTESSATLRAAKIHSNGMTSLPSSSTSLSAGRHICISTNSCQLSKKSPLESNDKTPGLCTDPPFDRADLQSQSCSLQLEAMELSSREAESSQLCSCFQSPTLFLKHCVECRTLHNFSCVSLNNCSRAGHIVVSSDSTDGTNKSGAEPLQGGSFRPKELSASQPLTSSSAAMTPSLLCDGPKSIPPPRHPITYHNCCGLGQLDPQVLCVSCGVFHSRLCEEQKCCLSLHTVKKLGFCKCGKLCSRKPLVLCRYCGNEYCNDCWYRSPVECECGQTFDQSSSV